LLARLHLDRLKSQTNLRRLKAALDLLPSELDETYKNAMFRIKGQVEEQSQLALKALSWISKAVRPLKLDEIHHALAVEPGDQELDPDGIENDKTFLVSITAGLLTVDSNSGTIRLVHFTAEEYFKKTWQDWFPDADELIAETCITYLMFDDFAGGYCRTDQELKSRLQNYPFLDYAARYWGFHANRGLTQKVQRLIMSFILQESKLSCTIQAMQVSGYLYAGYSQMVLRHVSGLSIAAMFGLEAIAQKVIDGGAEVDAKDSDGMTALHYAAKHGNEAVVKLLLKAKADVNNKGSDGGTALHYAARNGHEAAVKMLLDGKADVDNKDFDEGTALHYAILNGHEAVVKLLLIEAKADANPKNSKGKTALYLATVQGDEAVVELLLDAKADANSNSSDGTTPLHYAAKHGDEAVVKLLLKAKADVNKKGSDGGTALHYAAYNGHSTIVELLLKAEADVNNKDSDEWTALHHAAYNGHRAVFELLLDNGADINAQVRLRITAFHMAVLNGHKEVVKASLVREQDINAEDLRGRRGLYLAMRQDNKLMIEYLLAAGARIDLAHTDRQGCSAIHFAASGGSVTGLELLINPQFVNGPDTNGWTPLHWACRNGSESAVKLLIDSGALLESEDKQGHTPLDIAAICNNSSLVSHLNTESSGLDLKHNTTALEKKEGYFCDGCFHVRYVHMSINIIKLIRIRIYTVSVTIASIAMGLTSVSDVKLMQILSMTEATRSRNIRAKLLGILAWDHPDSRFLEGDGTA
jgi:ankyrin repeat protein